MILEKETYNKYGYYPSKLKPKSQKIILAKCERCGKIRELHRFGYRDLCHTCANQPKIIMEKELLFSLYWGNQFSAREIAKIFKSNETTIRDRMSKYNIPIRNRNESIKLSYSKYDMGFKNGITPWNKGKKNIYSDEVKYTMGNGKRGVPLEETHKDNCQCSFCKAKRFELNGDNHPNWKGGKSKEPYPFEFNDELKSKIRNRDDYTCQECGYTEYQLGYTLCVHHIDYNKNNCDESNLISLCNSCHAKTNYNRNDWIDYYMNKTAMLQVEVY